MFTSIVTVVAFLTATSQASPLAHKLAERASDITMTFSGGPASYTMTFPADGSFHATSMSLNPISLQEE